MPRCPRITVERSCSPDIHAQAQALLRFFAAMPTLEEPTPELLRLSEAGLPCDQNNNNSLSITNDACERSDRV